MNSSQATVLQSEQASLLQYAAPSRHGGFPPTKGVHNQLPIKNISLNFGKGANGFEENKSLA